MAGAHGPRAAGIADHGGAQAACDGGNIQK
jgi:hypothetical protein